MAEQQKRPFQMGTRLNKVQGDGYVTNNMRGQTVTLRLPKSGYGSKVYLVFTIAFSGTGTGTPAWGNALERAVSLVRNIRTRNNKNIQYNNLSGYSLMRLHDSLTRRGWNPTFTPAYSVALPSTVTGQTVWQFVIEIPFTPNQGTNFQRGLVPLQATQAEWLVEIQLDDMANVVTGMGVISGTIVVDQYLDFWEQPNAGLYASPNLGYAYILQEDTVNNLATGEFSYQVAPLQGDLFRTYFQFISGATPANYAGFSTYNTQFNAPTGPYVTDLGLRLGALFTPERRSAIMRDHEFARNYGQNPVSGLYVVQDAGLALDRPNEYSFPDFYTGFITPSKFADVRFFATLNMNGGVGYARVVKEYFQAIQYDVA